MQRPSLPRAHRLFRQFCGSLRVRTSVPFDNFIAAPAADVVTAFVAANCAAKPYKADLENAARDRLFYVRQSLWQLAMPTRSGG